MNTLNKKLIEVIEKSPTGPLREHVLTQINDEQYYVWFDHLPTFVRTNWHKLSLQTRLVAMLCGVQLTSMLSCRDDL